MIVSGTMQSVLKAYADAVPIKKKISENSTAAALREEKDEVVLSKQAQSFHHILQQVKTRGDVRTERVSTLSQQIAAGEYHPDASRIAEKILSYRY